VTITETEDDTRTPLLAAIEELRAREATPAVRIALAEAEFRLAIAPETAPEEAIDRLRAAIVQDPFCPKLFLHLGRLLHRTAGAVAALPEYRHALRLAPGSRRTHLLLALALLDMGPETRDLGDRLVVALNSGQPSDLKTAVAEVDAWLEEQSTPATPGADGPRKSRRPAVKPGKQATPDAWRVALHEQITRGKAQASHLSVLLRTGLARVADAGEIGEYATACVLLLAGGQAPRSVRDFAKSVLAGHADHPAVMLLTAALDLAEAGDAAAFAEMAADQLERGVLPLELVCCLHFSAYGPDRDGTVVDALAQLDRYPRPIRDSDCFDELRLAVLDGHARKAWTGERFDEARLLWQEAAAIDPFRVPVARNLALLAARTKAAQEYGSAWARLSELLYLQAAGAGDVQLLLEDRRTMHLALAQHAQQRHCASREPRAVPSQEQIRAWLADGDALTEWLDQWDLHYVNARLGFRSPAHLLGLPSDAEPEDRVAAAEAFVRHVELALSGRDWAGVAAFANLAAAQAQQALGSIGEIRDEHYEPERAEARNLTRAAAVRGLTRRWMMQELHRKPSGEQLRLGLDLARRQLALPWRLLRPICVEIGAMSDDVDPVKMFESDLVALATYWDVPEPKSPEEYADRLSTLESCVALVPHDLMLRLTRCRALRAADRQADAYAAALEALELPAPEGEDDESRQKAIDRLIDLVDVIGWEDIPESVRKPASPQAAATRDHVIQTARRALERYPRSALVRRELAKLLVATGGVDETNEAIALLGEGIELALSAEQRAELAERLTAIEPLAAVASIRASIRQLVEPAQESARAAIDGYVQNPVDETKKAALAALRAAIDKVVEGQRMAEQAALGDERASLDEVLTRLRLMVAELDGTETNDGGS
jgi:tetratricopeptide (TPR) repeat protein